jgi:hypothetical protein
MSFSGLEARIGYAYENAFMLNPRAVAVGDPFEREFRLDPSLSDDDPVIINAIPGPDAIHEVSLSIDEHPDAFALLLRAYNRYRGEDHMDDDFIAGQSFHEGQHIQAARGLGATALMADISFARYPDSETRYLQVSTGIHRFEGTRLGFALIIGHPSVLSDGDKANIRASNYTDVTDLARHAIEYNERHSGNRFKPYPLPLSRYDRR